MKKPGGTLVPLPGGVIVSVEGGLVPSAQGFYGLETFNRGRESRFDGPDSALLI